MTTRSRQKFTSILAVLCIVALMLLLIFLWTGVRNGDFSPNDTNKYHQINFSEINREPSAATFNFNRHHQQQHHHRHHQTVSVLTNGKYNYLINMTTSIFIWCLSIHQWQ